MFEAVFTFLIFFIVNLILKRGGAYSPGGHVGWIALSSQYVASGVWRLTRHSADVVFESASMHVHSSDGKLFVC